MLQSVCVCVCASASDMGCLCVQSTIFMLERLPQTEREREGGGIGGTRVTVAGGIISLKRKLIYVLAVMFKLMLQKLNAHK